MSERQSKIYGLHGEPETRIQLEFESLHKNKLDIPLERRMAAPNASTVAQGKPILVKTGGIWYIYIRIDNGLHRVALTAV